MNGDRTIGRASEPTPPGIVARVQSIIRGHWQYTGPPTTTHRRDYEIAAAAFGPVLARLRTLVETDLKALEDLAEAAGVPWTSGRIPVWP
jgi:hypothetical protein